MGTTNVLKLVRRSLLAPIRRCVRFWRMRGPSLELQGGSRARLISLSGFRMYIDQADPLVGRHIAQCGDYERHVTAALRRLLRPGDTFLDIGANIGYHSLTAAGLVGDAGRVIAVEMSPVNCAMLRASAAANELHNILVQQTAVAETATQLSFCLPERTGNGFIADNLLHHVHSNPDYFGQVMAVQAVTVDSLIPPGQRINVMKIDIEGSEMRAFRGMTRLLTEQRPVILLEYFPHMLRSVGGIDPVEVLSLLRGYGYTLHPVTGTHPEETAALTDAAIASLMETPVGLVDLLAWPPASR